MARTPLAIVAACVAGLSAPGVANAAVEQVFGSIQCEPEEGIRFCEGSTATRVDSFDGVPLDVNVAVPGEGDGPFPLVVFLHGYGGNKANNNASAKAYAARGYAALTYSARGFGNSCGALASRNDMGCLAGWVHLADSRFEVRDTQHLAGLLADEGVIDNQKVGVTGGSYGGGQSVQLAVLRDRIRTADGSYEPWVSPDGLPMRIAAAAPVIPWSDLVYSLIPNGRTLDYLVTGPTDDLGPIGVLKSSYVAGLFAAGQASGFYAPPGADAGADLTSWFARVNAGEPYDGDPTAEGIVSEIASNHSGYYLDMDREPAPTLISNGFTDDLFPVDEAVRYVNKVRAEFPGATVAQLHFDYGHARGQSKDADTARLEGAIAAWFDRHLMGGGPTLQGVEVHSQTCPAEAPSGGPFRAATWQTLPRGEVSFIEREPSTVLSGQRDPQVDQSVDPIGGGGACATTSATDQPGTATYRLPEAAGQGYTLLGSPTVIADLDGTGVNTAIVARLWDVAPDGGGQTLVARGLYRPRLDADQPREVFQLHPNAWRFMPGHVAKLELLGADSPYARTPNGQFQVTVSNLELRLPVAERPASDGEAQPDEDPDGRGTSEQAEDPQPVALPEGSTPVAGVVGVPVESTRPPAISSRRARSRTTAAARGRFRSSRYRVRVRGRVARRGSRIMRATDCRGRVRVLIRSNRRRVTRRSVRVRRNCRFASTLVFRRARLARAQRGRGRRARLRAVARFRGNRSLSQSRDVVRVRLRRGR